LIEKYGGGLTMDDVYGLKDREGRSLAQLASARGQLKKVFDTSRWNGRFDDLRAAWQKLPAADRRAGAMNDDDFAHLVAEEEQRQLLERSEEFTLKPRARKNAPPPPAP